MSDREIMNAKRPGNIKYNASLIDKLTNPFSKQQHHPDARRHQIVSFIKSAIRIVGYVLIPINILSAAIVLVISEVVGIIEELV